jgi:hypothetical protein
MQLQGQSQAQPVPALHLVHATVLSGYFSFLVLAWALQQLVLLFWLSSGRLGLEPQQPPAFIMDSLSSEKIPFFFSGAIQCLPSCGEITSLAVTGFPPEPRARLEFLQGAKPAHT